MPDSVRRYRLLPEGLDAAQQRVRSRYLVPQLFVIVLVLVLCFFLIARRNSDRATVLGVAVFGGFIITYFAFVGSRRTLRSMQQSWDTYVLEIGPDYLQRTLATTPDLRLPFSEITRIERLPRRFLRVIGSSRQRAIGIPETIENYPDILATLSALHPIHETRRDRSVKGFLLTVLGFGAFMAMLWSTDPRIVLPLAVLLTAFFVWFIVFMQHNPNVTYRARRQSRYYVILILMCILKVLAIFHLPPF